MTFPYDLGSHTRAISTLSDEAQTWFDRGLMSIYGFDLELACSCFKHAIENDSDCVMAHWGLAYASGIYYNKPWTRMQSDELVEKLKITFDESRYTKQLCADTGGAESMLADALLSRYQSSSPVSDKDYDRWNDDFANAMRNVYNAYPEDGDVCALFAEALMTRTPWALWDLKTGEPASNASTLEAIDVLETAMNRIERDCLPPHPGILHMYIHVMEMSPFPEKSLRACDALRELAPGSGHLCHMPSHIDVRCGLYYEAIKANNRAIEADQVYLEQEGAMNFHTLSRIHNYHLKIYAALFLGQYSTALDAANGIIDTTPEALLRIENPAMADWAEGYIGMKAHVYIRFGKWQEIIDHPLPDDPVLYAMTTAVWCYAKTIAYAATSNIADAETQREDFYKAVKRVPETRYLFNNTCLEILKIAEQMIIGEIEYRKENFDTAYDHLRRAVNLDDNLKYDEPWGWMQPARHALGALLLEQNNIEEAKQVYMDDLGLTDTLVSTSQHADNLWSLHGLVECLERQGRDVEAKQMRARLNLAKARADVPINASCACRIEHYCCND